MKTKTTHFLPFLLALCVGAVACDAGDDALPAAETDPDAQVQTAPPAAAPVSLVEAHHERLLESQERLTMPGAKAAFEQMRTLVQDKYVDGPLSEDELWTAAMQGVMDRLVQLEGHRINKLMSPESVSELMIGTKGRMVGVGIMIEAVADVVVVREVIADGPAEKAGLKAGDRILGIDGQRLGAMGLAEVVGKIRGEEGTKVDLFVQRDTEEWTETIERGQVKVGSVQSATLPGGEGYLRITSFSEDTPAELDDHLGKLIEGGAQSVVLDLRGCPGGLLDTALEVGERFLPPGSKLVTVKHRDGTADVHETKTERPHADLPMVVLIGPHTVSGAEILADALREHGRATLLGEQTLGKHTVEAIHELSDGWALKLSVSRFESASGESAQGVGVTPDIHIASPEDFKPAPLRELDLDADPVLAAGVHLLARQPR